MARMVACLLVIYLGFFGWCFSCIGSETPENAAKKIDELLASETLGSAPSKKSVPLANDETFFRRLSLDLTGTSPTTEDVVLYSLDTRQDKRAREVERQLASPRFGENWARYWRDVILYRRSEDRALITSEGCAKFLTAEFNKNTPWDKIATSFITAEGDVQENGETALIFAQAGQPEETVAEISRIFMGIQIQCAQCHDHPTDRWKREQFHQLAAFFPRVAVRPNFSGDQRTFIVAVNDREFNFFGMGNANQRFRGSPEHYMPDKNNPSARGTLVEPMLFLTQQSLKAGTKDATRRSSLAAWITSKDNEWFAKAFVNRMWAELVGEGFYEPIDDLGPDRQCSAEQTLNFLSTEFAASGYDVKWLFRTITSTTAYQRDSRSRRNPDETPFLANVSQRLRADQLYNNLLAVFGIDDRETSGYRPGMAGPGMFRRSPRALFNFAFGYDPSNPRDEIAGSIPQALVMMNSIVVNQMISAQRGTLGRMMNEIKDDEALTVELYLKTLSREPSTKEIEICRDYVTQIGNRGEAFEDILWSLINSTEFLHRR